MSESNASSRIKRLPNTYSGLVLMGAVGIPVGVIVGAICALFGRVLLAIGAFRDEHITLLLPFPPSWAWPSYVPTAPGAKAPIGA